MPLKDAQGWLNLYRHLHDTGVSMTDPDDPRSLIMPQGRGDLITRPLENRPKHEKFFGEYAERLVRRR
jgi:hypothetical protein